MPTRNTADDDKLNFWPSYTDVSLIMILILIVFLFSQLVSSAEGFKLAKIRTRQQTIHRRIAERLDAEALREMRFTQAFAAQHITFSDKILFEKGRAELQPGGERILARIAEVLRADSALYRGIQVEGHTDKDPVKGGTFRSNWDLSSARATAVVKFFHDHGIDPSRVPMSAAGFAEFRPIDRGQTEEAYRRNRRIELIIGYGADDAE